MPQILVKHPRCHESPSGEEAMLNLPRVQLGRPLDVMAALHCYVLLLRNVAPLKDVSLRNGALKVIMCFIAIITQRQARAKSYLT